MTDHTDAASLTRLLQLVSPTLPIGAYAYSTGLEHAISNGWVGNEAQARDWITGLAEHAVCRLDVPVLRHLYRAWQADELAQVRYWSRFLTASRESQELLAEDRHLGTALARLLSDLGMVQATPWIQTPDTGWATLFSLAASQWGIGERVMQQGYLWAWCENQVAAAVKLVPLGQTGGQRILSACAARIPAWVAAGQDVGDDAIGQFTPALAIGSAQHEQQYSRLFRS